MPPPSEVAPDEGNRDEHHHVVELTPTSCTNPTELGVPVLSKRGLFGLASTRSGAAAIHDGTNNEG
jgi:hypothetical protein